MAATSTAYVNPVDAIVDNIAESLLTNKKFKSFCDAGLPRKGRADLHKSLTHSLTALSTLLEQRTNSPLEKGIAWMLRGCRTAICLRICELLSPEKYSLNILISSNDHDVSSVNQQQLTAFINKAFTVEDHLSISIANAWSDAHKQRSPPYDLDWDDTHGTSPNFDLFSDLDSIRSILCSDEASNALCARLQSALFPRPRDLIEQALRDHIPLTSYENNKWCIACVIEWQLLQYIEDENLTANNVNDVFTINGDLESASVARFGDYALMAWPSGSDLLAMVMEIIQAFRATHTSRNEGQSIHISRPDMELQLFSASAVSKEQALVKLSGSYNQIREVLEQLAWLAAALRPPFEGQLTVSEIDIMPFKLSSTSFLDSLHTPAILRISLINQAKASHPHHELPGQCWTSVCTESVLVYGFSMPKHDRPENLLGLEIPFDIMAAFSGVRYPIFLKGKIVFAGHSCVLFPAFKSEDESIQWHYIQSGNWWETVIQENSENWDLQLQSLTLSSLTQSRAFLGYCRNAEVLLGTVEFEHVDAAESGVPRTSNMALDLAERWLKVEIDDDGCAKGLDGKMWKFNRSETMLIRASGSYADERFEQAARSSALLYDQESSTAFLVSELSFVLHLVAVHLRTHSQLKRQKIPLASISADGGRAAFEAIMKMKYLVVDFTEGHVQSYFSIVESFLDILDQRKTQAIVHRLYTDERKEAGGIRGWDQVDLQERRFEISELELKLDKPKSQPVWWKLFQTPTTLVVFTKVSKFPIRINHVESNYGAFSCRAWDNLPKGKHLLLAPTIQLQHLQATLRDNLRTYPARFMLNDYVAWIRPRDSRLFEQNCQQGGTCNPMQMMVQMNVRENNQLTLSRGYVYETSYQRHPGELIDTGAVVFADQPKDFEPRLCWRHPRPRALSQSDWNYPFIGVSFLVIVLAYWNSRLIAFGMVLAGIAYVLK